MVWPLLVLFLTNGAAAATYQAEVDVTPAVQAEGRVHVVMTLHWLEESMPTPPVFCVTTPDGWRPEGAVAALKPRRGTPKPRAVELGGLPSDQLDAARPGEGWACVVGKGRRWKQGASGTVVFTLRPPANTSGEVQIRTAVGRFDRSVHAGEPLTVVVGPDAPTHSNLAADPLFARRVFDALDTLDVLAIEARSLSGQLGLRQPPPVEQRVAFITKVAERQATTLEQLASPMSHELPGYTATFNQKRDAASSVIHGAASEWLERTCAHKTRLLAEPANEAHVAKLVELQAELEGLGPALDPWWADDSRAEVERCTRLGRADVPQADPPGADATIDEPPTPVDAEPTAPSPQ